MNIWKRKKHLKFICPRIFYSLLWSIYNKTNYLSKFICFLILKYLDIQFEFTFTLLKLNDIYSFLILSLFLNHAL